MKKLLSILLLGVSASAFSAVLPEFSAFSKGDKLVVTVLGDSCNSYGASLEVNSSCDSRRLTRNFAYSCRAELKVSSSELYCGNSDLDTPKVMELSLSENFVTKEAKKLYLKYNGAVVTVALDQLGVNDEPVKEINAKEIYEALKVKAVNLSPRYGSVEFQKSVGGLVCTNNYSFGGGTYKCTLRQNNNSEKIYEALTVKPKHLNPGIAGSYRLGKLVGGLECVKSGVVYHSDEPEYTCTLD